MASNDKILLDQIISKSHNSIAPDLSDDEFFEVYTTELVLRKFGLSYDEIDSGIIGGSADGGIDAIYAFVDDELITPDSKFDEAKTIEIVIVQAKRSPTYHERAINNLISTFGDLLDLETNLEHFAAVYNSDVIGFFRDFREVYKSVILKFPTLKFSFYYVTKGDTDKVHPNVLHRKDMLERRVTEHFSSSKFAFEFVGARELFDLARKQAAPNLQLKITESLSPDDGGFICLVTLQDYHNFIIDEEGNRRQVIFDANVREYEGSVEVNKDIRKTLLEGSHGVNFWWLNNGCTIVATKAVLSGKNMALEDAKVVNGLQTSQEIYRHFSTTSDRPDERLVLVRIITTDSEDIRNQIIRATNNQSKIPPYSLRATEHIHHNIEQDFLHNGLFYDRQKNYYKNQRKPKNQIITIQYLAQAVAAIILQRPNDSRGRPTTLIKSDDIYKRTFNEVYPISIYLKAAKLMRMIDTYLRNDAPSYISKEKTNLRYHLAMFLPILTTESSTMTTDLFATINLDEMDSELLKNSAEHVWQVFEDLKRVKGLDGDLIAKNSDFDLAVINRANEILAGERTLEFESSNTDEH